MGAAASIEALKPADASDVTSTGELLVAKAEIMRLREALGAFAKDAGFAEVVYDASDLVLGTNEKEDFDRCVAEIVHIRAALRLSTAAGKRRERNRAPKSFFDTGSDDEMATTESSSDDEAQTGEGEGEGEGGEAAAAAADSEKNVERATSTEMKV